jgi:hypothetical protein
MILLLMMKKVLFFSDDHLIYLGDAQHLQKRIQRKRQRQEFVSNRGADYGVSDE